MRETNTVKVWGCGGMGISTVSHILNAKLRPGQAKMTLACVDTSNSNLLSTIPDEITYLLEDVESGDKLDGSGQKRNLNYRNILPQVKHVIQSLKPSQLNIIVHSLSGGSGSVVGPMIAKELLTKDQLVIVLAVKDSSTRLYTENTLNTLKTYESISQQTGVPIVMVCYNNQNPNGRKDVDSTIVSSIDDLLYLFSNQNYGLDSQDLFHWLRYDKISNREAHLSLLDMIYKDEEIPKNLGNPITVVTLKKEEENSVFPNFVEYQVEGVIPSEAKEAFPQALTHFVVFDNSFFIAMVKSLTSTIEEMDSIVESQISRGKIVDSNEADDNGMVF